MAWTAGLNSEIISEEFLFGIISPASYLEPCGISLPLRSEESMVRGKQGRVTYVEYQPTPRLLDEPPVLPRTKLFKTDFHAVVRQDLNLSPKIRRCYDLFLCIYSTLSKHLHIAVRNQDR
ncbi:uncharacterized protein LAJ45_05399 [Morchella importuna]|uniref:uncharacterized protein n=1 Tax=Morchella importuna TaxID=1174673 RepID=UPI001E8DC5DC|nr:uncharacterized protein LAJ45_05399 [Morchella importuna]KAH8150703.1 hypothetical protein LAJ45_05399 [Morchella importuna]